jgi:hypothetical protein
LMTEPREGSLDSPTLGGHQVARSLWFHLRPR